jgi:hypothetical protein
MDEKLAKTLAAPDFELWRAKLWREVSLQAIGEGWVPEYEVTEDGLIDSNCDRWATLWETLVGLRSSSQGNDFRLTKSRLRSDTSFDSQYLEVYMQSSDTPPKTNAKSGSVSSVSTHHRIQRRRTNRCLREGEVRSMCRLSIIMLIMQKPNC